MPNHRGAESSSFLILSEGKTGAVFYLNDLPMNTFIDVSGGL